MCNPSGIRARTQEPDPASVTLGRLLATHTQGRNGKFAVPDDAIQFGSIESLGIQAEVEAVVKDRPIAALMRNDQGLDRSQLFLVCDGGIGVQELDRSVTFRHISPGKDCLIHLAEVDGVFAVNGDPLAEGERADCLAGSIDRFDAVSVADIHVLPQGGNCPRIGR